MEGIVMELYRDHVIVMTNSGEFVKLKKHGLVNIGDIYKGSLYHHFPIAYYAAAAILIFVISSFAGYAAYANQIVGYVDIAGQKNVRLYISRNGTVGKVDGLASSKTLKNLPLNEAIEKAINLGTEEGIYTEASEVKITTTKTKSSKIDFNSIDKKAKEITSKSKLTPTEKKDEKIKNNEKGKEQGTSNNNNNNEDKVKNKFSENSNAKDNKYNNSNKPNDNKLKDKNNKKSK